MKKENKTVFYKVINICMKGWSSKQMVKLKRLQKVKKNGLLFILVV